MSHCLVKMLITQPLELASRTSWKTSSAGLCLRLSSLCITGLHVFVLWRFVVIGICQTIDGFTAFAVSGQCLLRMSKVGLDGGVCVLACMALLFFLGSFQLTLTRNK